MTLTRRARLGPALAAALAVAEAVREQEASTFFEPLPRREKRSAGF